MFPTKFNLKEKWKNFLRSLLFKTDRKDLDVELQSRIEKIKENLIQYFQLKGQGYSSLILIENGKCNFNDDFSTITLIFPQINTYVQVHSHLSKPYSTLELMGISKLEWENYQKRYNNLRADLEKFNSLLTYVEFFWNDPIDYISVAKRMVK